MRNVLVIKGADFSAVKVETIQLKDNIHYEYEDYLYKEDNWFIDANGTSPMTHGPAGNTTFGGFVDLSQYRGDEIIIKNNDENQGSFYFYIKSVDFSTGVFTACEGRRIQVLSKGATKNDTIPADADYLYIVYTRNNSIVNTSVDILTPIQ